MDLDYDFRQVAYWGKPNIGQIVRSLEEAYERRGDPEMKAAAIAKAEPYRADAVFDAYWKPILAEMEAALPVPMNRAARRAARKR